MVKPNIERSNIPNQLAYHSISKKCYSATKKQSVPQRNNQCNVLIQRTLTLSLKRVGKGLEGVVC